MERAGNSDHQTGGRTDADITQTDPTAAQVEESFLIRGYKEND